MHTVQVVTSSNQPSSNDLHKQYIYIYIYITPWDKDLPQKRVCSQQVRKSPHFVETKGLSPCPQQPNTCPYSEPAECSPCLPIIVFSDLLKCYPLIYACVFQMVSSFQVSPPKPLLHVSSHPCMLHAPPISFSLP